MHSQQIYPFTTSYNMFDNFQEEFYNYSSLLVVSDEMLNSKRNKNEYRNNNRFSH